MRRGRVRFHGLSGTVDGVLTADETPGGGLTMVLPMPAAPSQQGAAGVEVS